MPRTVLRSFLGILAALGAMELAVRPLASAERPPEPAIARDRWDAPTVTVRQMEEGIATAHFSVAGARLTGNQPIPGAPVVVLLGDSHVVAREVADGETMGAWIERLARASGQALDVRQYGWRGASPPQYAVVADTVLARWHPARVVVALGPDDLGPDPLVGKLPRMRIAADGAVSVVTRDSGAVPTSAPADGPLVRRSALAWLLRSRWYRLVERAPPLVRRLAGEPATDRDPHADVTLAPAVPPAVVRLLAEAYGERLLIVYAADIRVAGGERPDSAEALLLGACAARGVPCVSTRGAMLAARARGGIARGFATTTLGVGHLNALGHRIVGEAAWAMLRRSGLGR